MKGEIVIGWLMTLLLIFSISTFENWIFIKIDFLTDLIGYFLERDDWNRALGLNINITLVTIKLTTFNMKIVFTLSKIGRVSSHKL